MVTELMDGGDVEGLIEKAEDNRIPLERSIAIGQEVCRGLEYAHSRGIVHRDLKPGNVWMTSDGTAKIGDFGLALPMNRSRLTQEGMMVGTVSYMPPEQATGGEVTPRADLYSLGAMLYEMVTGRPPFMGDDPVAIISQHINTTPVSPTWHCPQCPRPLEALVMRLLAKDPAQRPESAGDVLAALAAMDLADVAERPSEEEGGSLDSLAGGVFVGRQREMGELKGTLEEALSGHGRLITLVGEPGIGKTRTALELATYAGLRRAQVLWGRCYETQGMPPYWPWVQAIGSYVRERDPDELRAEMGMGAADIAEVVSDVKQRLPGLQPSPPLDDPEAARFRLFDSITAFLKSASNAQPLVLTLDDLHWADESSLMLLQFVAGEIGSSRLLLLGTYRDVELSRRHPLARTLGELTRERTFRRVLLRGLRKQDVAQFMELTAGMKPPRGLVDAVYVQTEGNPLFVNEVVRLLVQEGELTPERARRRTSWTVRIPEGVREVVGRRLDRLSERCNEALGVASVIGREFTLQQLQAVAKDLSEERLLELMEEAMRARVVEEIPQAVDRYQFTHALIQETLSEELSLTRRVRLHANIAQALEEMYGDEVEAHAAELAYHSGQAESVLGTEKLVRYSLIAGERALETYAYEESADHFRRGLSAKDHMEDEETASLLYGLGRAEAALLNIDEAAGCLSRAFNYYQKNQNIDGALDAAGVPFTGTRGRALMAPVVERALEMVEEDSIKVGWLLAEQGRFLGADVGDYDRACHAFERALAIARSNADKRLELRVLTNWANVAGFHVRVQESSEKNQLALELLESVDSPWDASLVHYMIMRDFIEAGDAQRAKEHGAKAIAAAEILRDKERLSSMNLTNAFLAYFYGELDESRTFLDRALASWPENFVAPCMRTQVECEKGEFDRAGHFLQRMTEGGERRLESLTVFDKANLAFATAIAGRIKGTRDHFDLATIAASSVLNTPDVAAGFAAVAGNALGLIAIQVDDTDMVKSSQTTLKRLPDWPLYWGIFCKPHMMGLLASALGDVVEATTQFESCIALLGGIGGRLELAWTCCDYADTLLGRDDPGDREKAISLLDESLAISRELGMRLLMERVLSRRNLLKA
jgi:tetratricopeptide (TPR) repeat protein